MSSIKAFTLVELAIVITIIGLLIGGVLKGQELLENARLTSVSAEIKSYDTAVTTFRDLYKGLPGDLLTARDFIQGCTAGNNCFNGNGNGIIGANAERELFFTFDVTLGAEHAQFWKHLALANLINGIDVTASAMETGKSIPRLKVDSGLMARSAAQAGTSGATPWPPNKMNSGIALVTVDSVTNVWDDGGASLEHSMTPSLALKLDLKMDDGKPMLGDTQALSYNYVNGCGENPYVNGGSYNVNVSGKKCASMFNIQN